VKEGENKSGLSYLLTTLGLLLGNTRSRIFFTSNLSAYFMDIKKIDKDLIALMPQVSHVCSAKICLLSKVFVQNSLSKGDAEGLSVMTHSISMF